jgi:hypothetical protein
MVVNSIDNLRLRVEKISDQLSRFNLSNYAHASAAANNKAQEIAQISSSGKTAGSGEFANSEFYDKSAQDGGRLIFAISSETKNMNSLLNNEAFVSTLWDFAMIRWRKEITGHRCLSAENDGEL